jgi:ABC-2 type transport system ATP-binding protein
MKMPEAVVQVEELRRSFGDFVAVNDIRFTVYKGEIFGFLGANGAGKTTTIRMLCGLLPATSGRGTVSGLDIHRQRAQIKTKIGYMSQKFSLYPDLKVIDNLYFYGRLYRLRDAAIVTRLAALQEFLPHNDIKTQLTRDLPLGRKQMVALLAALLHDPPIIFLDEPTSGVDPLGRRAFWQVIRNFAAAGKTVFVTTHFMEEAEYCDRISIMHHGDIIALDSPEQLLSQYGVGSVQDLFLTLIRDAG